MPVRLSILSVIVALIPSLGLACQNPADGLRFLGEAVSRLRCERSRIRGDHEVDCHDQASSCAAELDRLALLVFGDADGPVETSSPEWRCQKAIDTGARGFLRRRVRDLVRGVIRSSSAAARLMARIEERCQGVLPSGGVPTVGGGCATLADPFDPTAANRCLRGALEALAQEVTGIDIAPNVLFVLTDDQRWDTLPVMTLTQAALGRRGLEFTQSFTSTSLCCPDRASILTGLYAHNHGVTSNAGALDFDHNRDTIARQLHEHAGYRTALLGKYMVNTGAALGTSIPPGWDEWQVFTQDGNDGSGRLYYNYDLNENGVIRTYGSAPADYSTDLLRDRALAVMRSWRDGPWFIEVAFFAPHDEAFPADRHRGAFAGIAPHRPPSYLESDLTDKPNWLGTQKFFVLATESEPEATDQRRIDQLETLLAVDEAVAALSQDLEALGLTDNTLVVFTSDNGFMWLEHWLRLKNYPYEESLRVPLLMRYPKLIPAPRQASELVQSIDFYPTFAGLAGIPGEPVNGRSLVPLLRGDSVGWREDILFEHFHHIGGIDPHAGVRTQRWKLIETEASGGVTTELYDLEADPYELDSVANEPENAAVIAQLQARLAGLRAE
jgi:arylsulfatase A-like enzyme